jgi:predicted nucleic acid-binding protein
VTRVFLDSGAFFAALIAQDASHDAATEAFQRAQTEGWALVTTNAVVIETYALLLSRTRAGRSAAIAFLDALEQSSIQEVAV